MLLQSIQTANESFGNALEISMSDNKSKVVFALPQEKVCWITVIKGLILIGLIIGVATWIMPFWLFVIILLVVVQIHPFYKTYHQTVVDIKGKTVREKLGFITTKECSLADYERPLFYCLSTDGASPILEDFCLMFKENGKRKELFVAHIGANDTAKTSAHKEVLLTLWEALLKESGADVPENVTSEIRLTHRNAIFK